jgi:hypothetical protein
MQRAVDERRFVVVLVVVFAAVTLFVAWHHEAWRDEADGWLFARDGGLGDFLAYTRHGGTPGLWLLILMPIAKSGLPYFSQAVLHWAIACASVAILAMYAPFSRLTKALIAFSYFFSYEYAVIARSYALTVLLAFLAAVLYRKRPIAFAIVVALLFNVNAQGFALAIAFAILAGRDWRRIAIMAAGAIASWLQVRTPSDPARHAGIHAPIPEVFQWSVGNAFFPTVPPLLGFALGMVVLLAITISIRRSREAMLMLWLPTAGLAMLYVYIWIGGLRHAGFFLIAAILAVWVAGGVDRIASVVLNIALAVSCAVAVTFWVRDYRANFSGAAEMAAYVRQTSAPIAAHNLTQCEALLPYLPGRSFWYAGLEEDGTFLKWDAAFERALSVPYPVAEARAKQHFAGKKWLLLFNVEMPDPAAHGFRLLYTNRRPIFEKTDEHYWLYAPLQ